ncbi:hypothetical protein BH24ACT16_BH24ACT16_08340 [soil metagenome]
MLRPRLGIRDWCYLLALLFPLVVYNLALKAKIVFSRDEIPGLLEALGLMRSDLLFSLGYTLLWIGLFSALRRGVGRAVVKVMFHLASVAVMLVTTSAVQYFAETGSTLDYSVLAYSLSTLDELLVVIGSGASTAVWIGLAAALLYFVFAPALLSRVGELLWRRRTVRRQRPNAEGHATFVTFASYRKLGALALCVAAFSLVGASMFTGKSGEDSSFSRSPVSNVFVTGITPPAAESLGSGVRAGPIPGESLVGASLSETPETEKRNVVLIHLESVRAFSTTPYNEDIETTPFLDQLADQSLLVERAYTVIPHSSKATTAVNCGVNPHPDTEIHEAEPGGIPVKCLPEMLADEGYNTAYFQSATADFENRAQQVENFGYRDFYPLESMDTEGFERANYFGYEDDIMLEPSRRWLRENSDSPFLAEYMTLTPHHEYLAPDRYGRKNFAEEERLDDYLNSVRYLDFFIKNLLDQYKEMGLYEDTVFVFYGDHGEGFAEHGVRGHDNVVYDEGLRVPMMIHDPQRWRSGARVGGETPSNQLDLAPTIVDMLGYELEDGEYPGSTLLEPLPQGRALNFNCRPDLKCAARIEGYEKYIYHYGKEPEEFYDLRKDPRERDNIIGEQSEKKLSRMREELLQWRLDSAALYDNGGPEGNSEGG